MTAASPVHSCHFRDFTVRAAKPPADMVPPPDDHQRKFVRRDSRPSDASNSYC